MKAFFKRLEATHLNGLGVALGVAATHVVVGMAFGETAGGFRRLIQIIFGLSIAFSASSFFLSFFSFGGGALIA